MESIDLSSILGTAGAGSPLITLFILWKMGLLGKNGKNGDYKAIVQNHEERLDVANKEMGDVKVSLARIDERTIAMEENIKEIKLDINGIYKQFNART